MPGLADVLRAADARWEAAGVDPARIVIGPGGSPVTLVADLGTVAKGRVLGVTATTGRSGELEAVRSMRLADMSLDNVTHEMGHALGIGAASFVSHPVAGEQCAAGAADRPVMCEVEGHTITAADLTEACAVGACVGFSPEL